MSFFKHFPTIFYNGQQAKNIMARARLTPESKRDMSLYYPYTIKDADGRPELLSHQYYDDIQSVWMIFFANDSVDPYYALGLDQENFNKYIVKKYGSVELAQQKVAFYRTNWEALEDSSISAGEFDSLVAVEKKYWQPVLDVYGSINSYERKREDLVVNTNRIFEFKIEDADGEFEVGEKVSTNSTTYGFCTSSNSSVVVVNNVLTVNTSNVVDGTLTGSESGATATVTESILLSENISSDVQAKYWSPVSYYDTEDEVNTLKKNIQMIDKRFKNKMEDELKRAMRL